MDSKLTWNAISQSRNLKRAERLVAKIHKFGFVKKCENLPKNKFKKITSSRAESSLSSAYFSRATSLARHSSSQALGLKGRAVPNPLSFLSQSWRLKSQEWCATSHSLIYQFGCHY